MGDDGFNFQDYLRPERKPGESDAEYAYRCRRFDKERARRPGESDELYARRLEELERNRRYREKHRAPRSKRGRKAQQGSGVNKNSSPGSSKAQPAELSTDNSMRDPSRVALSTSESNVIRLSERLPRLDRKSSNSDAEFAPEPYSSDRSESYNNLDSSYKSGGVGGDLSLDGEGLKAPLRLRKDWSFPFRYARERYEKKLYRDSSPEAVKHLIPWGLSREIEQGIHELLVELGDYLYVATKDREHSSSLVESLRAEVRALFEARTEKVVLREVQTRPLYSWREDRPVRPEVLDGYPLETYLARGYSLGLVDLVYWGGPHSEPMTSVWWRTPTLEERALLLGFFDKCLAMDEGDLERAIDRYMVAVGGYAMTAVAWKTSSRSYKAFVREATAFYMQHLGPLYVWTRERILLRWQSIFGLPFELGEEGESPVEEPPAFAVNRQKGLDPRQVKRFDEDYDVVTAAEADEAI